MLSYLVAFLSVCTVAIRVREVDVTRSVLHDLFDISSPFTDHMRVFSMSDIHLQSDFINLRPENHAIKQYKPQPRKKNTENRTSYSLSSLKLPEFSAWPPGRHLSFLPLLHVDLKMQTKAYNQNIGINNNCIYSLMWFVLLFILIFFLKILVLKCPHFDYVFQHE